MAIPDPRGDRLVDAPACPVCGTPITEVSCDRDVSWEPEHEPAWDGGPLIPIPGTERPVFGPRVWQSLSCGHVFDPDGMSWTYRNAVTGAPHVAHFRRPGRVQEAPVPPDPPRVPLWRWATACTRQAVRRVAARWGPWPGC